VIIVEGEKAMARPRVRIIGEKYGGIAAKEN
jgi:hypothetical protein